MRTRAFATAMLVAFLPVAFPPTPAQAQEKDAITDMARQRFQEGVKFFDQKKFEEARAAFLQAYALKHHPAVLLNLAQSELRSGHLVDAARHFSAFLRESSTSTGLERSEAERGLAEARSKIGRLRITVSASGAEVSVDGEQVGQSPLADTIDVSPGTHSIEAKLNGRSAESSVSAPAGRITAVSLSLEGGAGAGAASPVPATPPPAAPSPPASSGDDEGPAAPPPSEKVSRNATEQPASAEAKDTGASVSSAEREPFFQWLTRNPVGIAGTLVTVGGLGVWVGFAVASQSAGNSAQDLETKIKQAAQGDFEPQIPRADPPSRVANPCNPDDPIYPGPCQALRDNLNRQNTDNQIATYGAVVFGIGVAGTIVGYFLTSKKTSDSSAASVRPSVVPVVAPHHGGLAIAGSF